MGGAARTPSGCVARFPCTPRPRTRRDPEGAMRPQVVAPSLAIEGLERDFQSPAPIPRGELAGCWSHAASPSPEGADDGHLDLSASKERLTIGADGRRDQQ